MDNYQGVPLGVEAAWPGLSYTVQSAKAASTMRSTLAVVLGLAVLVAGLALLAS